eukprot:7143379-Prymnesium_polylepis.1
MSRTYVIRAVHPKGFSHCDNPKNVGWQGARREFGTRSKTARSMGTCPTAGRRPGRVVHHEHGRTRRRFLPAYPAKNFLHLFAAPRPN